jgi:hypothetical protein
MELGLLLTLLKSTDMINSIAELVNWPIFRIVAVVPSRSLSFSLFTSSTCLAVERDCRVLTRRSRNNGTVVR